MISTSPSATSWNYPNTGTPDYLNQCGTAAVGVPNNAFGTESAKTGVAYAGFYTYNSFFPNDGREYIQVKLNDTLDLGKKYFVSFWVSLADNMKYATNTVGAYFSPSPITSMNTYVFSVTAQIQNNSLNPLTSKTGWRLISDTLFANGGELYMTIGNFMSDSLSDTTYVSSGWSASYYYIDDVSVIDIGWVGLNENNNIENQISIFPNPAKDFISVSFKSNNIGEIKMSIVNTLGETIMSKILNNNETQIQVSDLPAGVYYCKFVSAQNQILAAKKIIIIR